MELINKLIELINDDFKNIKTPEILGIGVIILLIFKKIFRGKYIEIINKISKAIISLDIVSAIFELIFIIYFILSVIVSFALVIYMVKYMLLTLLFNNLKNKNKDKDSFIGYIINFEDKLNKVNRFFKGSKIVTLKVNSWFLVLVGYFYLFAEKKFIEYYKLILSYLNINNLISIPIIIYIIIIFFSFLLLLEKIIYKLYFKD